MRTIRPLAFISLLLICLLYGLAGATWPFGDPLGLPICTDEDAQFSPRIVADGIGGAIIVWEDRRGGDYDIYGQHVDAWGHVLWPDQGLQICGLASSQSYPRIIADGEGGAFVTWLDSRGGNWDIYAQRVDHGGTLLWPAGGVAVVSEAAGQFNHEIVSDGAGGMIVVWADDRAGMDDWNIYAQRLEADGSVLWTAGGMAVCTATDHQQAHHVVADGSGGVVIAWSDNRTENDGDLYAQRLSSGGFSVWTADGIAVCTVAGPQRLGSLLADGVGGAFFVWDDTRSGNYDIYGQHVNSYGADQWTTNGLALRDETHDEFFPTLASDGAGGFILAWADTRSEPFHGDIYANRVDRDGNLLWSASDMEVCTASNFQSNLMMISDGVGGAVVSWQDARLTGYEADVYVQRLDGTGTALWTTNGVAAETDIYRLDYHDLATDEAGGVFLAWQRGSSEDEEGDIYAQRVERHGYAGSPAPFIVEIVDHPADQGGEVILSWGASPLDAFPHQEITHYSVWRRNPHEAKGVPEVRQLLLSPEKSGWSYVDQVVASYWPEYAYEAPTYADSTAAGLNLTEYVVLAQTADQWTFWGSPPAPGYSVDNLAPGAPLLLAAQDDNSDVRLDWSPSGWHDEDLASYRLYRSATSGFTPGAGNFLAAVTDTLHTDPNPGGGNWYYRVTGVDVHGNEGSPSNEASALVVSAVTPPPGPFALLGNYPNPFNPRTTILYRLDAPATVTLRVFDVTGRLVRTLRHGIRQGAGPQSAVWDGKDAEGRLVASGVYYYRLESGSEQRMRRMVLLK